MPSLKQITAAIVPLLFAATVSLPAQRTGGNPPVGAPSAERGTKLYAESCAKCHGNSARGTATAPDLLHSVVVLHDRFDMLHGKEMAATLKSAPHQFNFNEAQLADLSQFLTLAVNKILRTGYSNQPINLLTGNAKAGETYFNGPGGCTKCHSTTGDLAGVAKRYTPATLQQRMLFPNSALRGAAGAAAKKTQVTVTQPSGKSVTGSLVRIDDFNVTLRDESGASQTFNRAGTVKVKLVDPFAGHIELLDRYTDPDIHNLLAYLVTLK